MESSVGTNANRCVRHQLLVAPEQVKVHLVLAESFFRFKDSDLGWKKGPQQKKVVGLAGPGTFAW